MRSRQTENDPRAFAAKVSIRQQLADMALEKRGAVRVLDAFAAEGRLWAEVSKTRKLDMYTGIETRDLGQGPAKLRGDSAKYISALMPAGYNIVDLDAFGYPVDQLRELQLCGYRGYAAITAISSGMGRIPNAVLNACGIPSGMAASCPSLFRPYRERLLYGYLHSLGAVGISSYTEIEGKCYLSCEFK